MALKICYSDFVSNSFFPAIAAVELGFFEEEDIDAEHELIFPAPKAAEALREGDVDMIAGSAHSMLWAFPRWRGVRLLCSLSQGIFFFLVMRADAPVTADNLTGLKGMRIRSAPDVDRLLKATLRAAGIDPDKEGIEIGPPKKPVPKGTSFGVASAQALINGEIDGFWANAMATELAVREGIGKVVLDIRRGIGPQVAFNFTQPTLATHAGLVEEQPEICAAAVRAMSATLEALKEDPSLAAKVGEKLFPPKEAALIAGLIERDLPFYSTRITEEFVAGLDGYTREVGLLDGDPVPYDNIVATEFSEYWT